ncbi:ArsR/SmtB family transcription factor [Enteractinococcus helveticum]|uniref:Transcriptional regulator n=1 Tax=Enteractinococcus helveticum TaxID=1837282 RepID=A0A1B7M1P5_9MICC|nr:metalloregulator ArsR/SmtB family transcription factor [Enteractinococcus helveticum]OAV62480.1 transcriptional regulator [Enteractinococcus helveticum]
MTVEGRLNSAFAALADPTRRDILQRLQNGPMTVGQLAEHYPMSRPAISQHLGVLEKAGLIQRRRRAQWIECVLVDDALDEVTSWVEQQRAEWADRFDHLEDYLTKEKTDD